MWVKIKHRNEQKFIGTLRNCSIDFHDLKYGQEISFGVENILDTEYDDPAYVVWDYYFDTKVTVSSDVHDKEKFNLIIRDTPKSEEDSGWSIFSGYEDDDFLNDTDNFQLISIGVILNMDDSILEFIEEPPLCAFGRNNEGVFYKIDDYDWEAYLKNLQ